MTAEMPPQLAALAEQYDQLYDSAEAGHISQNDALSALAGLSATDATGRVWAINAAGEFTAADYPGAPAVPTDPAHFAAEAPAEDDTPPAFLAPPGPWDAPPPAAAANDPHAAPPVSPGRGPAAAPAPAGWGSDWDADDEVDDDMGDLLTPPQVPDRTAARPTGERATAGRSLRDAEDGPRSPLAKLRGKLPAGLGDRLPTGSTLWHRHKALLIVLAVGAALLGYLMWGPSKETTPLPSTDPGATAVAMPTDAAGQPVAATELPTGDDVSRVRSALTSGDRDTVAGALAIAVDTPTLADLTAYFHGATETGLDVAAGPAAAEPAGAVQNWTVNDVDTNVAVRAYTVHWVVVDGIWKLAGPPTAS